MEKFVRIYLSKYMYDGRFCIRGGRYILILQEPAFSTKDKERIKKDISTYFNCLAVIFDRETKYLAARENYRIITLEDIYG
jgi:hypothetical protein